MVLAAVVLDGDQSEVLARLGIRDSKSFGASQGGQALRARLAEQVAQRATFVSLEVIGPWEIDRWVGRGGLNRLEQTAAGRLLARAPDVDRIVADGARLFAPLTRHYPQLVAMDRAEATCVAVAAASVVAKARRDELFACIAERYRREFGRVGGGGYPNAFTRRFLQDYRERYGTLPPETRRSWKGTEAHTQPAAAGQDRTSAAGADDPVGTHAPR
jgi:ribonuclease HII